MKLSLRTLASVAVVLAVGTAGSAGAQTAATICKDGTTSATSGQGTCSGHGGIDKQATAKAKIAAKKQAKAVKTAAKKEAKAAKVAAKETPRMTATVKCADGSMSSATGQGACSGHGGVKAVVKPIVSESDDKSPKGAIARCKDGLYSHAKSKQGACSAHGGVAKWM